VYECLFFVCECVQVRVLCLYECECLCKCVFPHKILRVE
jgi:hypothetical protein